MTRPATKPRPATIPEGDAVLILCGHGSHGGVGSAGEHAAAIRRLGRFAEVRACCLKGTPELGATIESLEAQPRILLVPMLMAEGYTLRTLHRRLEQLGAGVRARLSVAAPVGSHPRLGWMIAARARDACASRRWRPGETGLLVVGHGTRRDPKSGATARQHAQQIRAGGWFAEVALAFLDEEPSVIAALAGSARARWVVVGLFADRGEHGESDIPVMLASTGRGTLYAGPIGAEPRMVDLILDQVRALDDAATGADRPRTVVEA